MATFGALGDDPNAAARALACAFALDGEVTRWSRKRVARGTAPIRIAIGVHHGPVVVGNLGSERRIEFTVVGDTVNAASRLEKAARDLDCTIVISDACRRAAKDHPRAKRFDRMVELRLRGRGAPILVHLAGSAPFDGPFGPLLGASVPAAADDEQMTGPRPPCVVRDPDGGTALETSPD